MLIPARNRERHDRALAAVRRTRRTHPIDRAGVTALHRDGHEFTREFTISVVAAATRCGSSRSCARSRRRRSDRAAFRRPSAIAPSSIRSRTAAPSSTCAATIVRQRRLLPHVRPPRETLARPQLRTRRIRTAHAHAARDLQLRCRSTGSRSRLRIPGNAVATMFTRAVGLARARRRRPADRLHRRSSATAPARKLAEQELAQAKEAAEAANRRRASSSPT